MNKEGLIKLTSSLYQLTLLFPKKEPLRYKMREIADDILASLLLVIKTNPYENRSRSIIPLFDNLEALDGFFEVAKAQNWVSPTETLNLQDEYNRIRKEIENPIQLPQHYEIQAAGSLGNKEVARPAPVPDINERQRKILEILKEKGSVQAWELKRIIPEVSKRTIRRDFEHLLRQGLIARIGERNDTFYQLKVGQDNG